MKPTHVKIITGAVSPAQADSLPEISVQAERRSLARRIWRTVAEDGLELGFDLSAPLRHGELVLVTGTARYVMRQSEELVVEIPIPGEAPRAALLGWTIGNLHCAIEVREDCLVAADEGGLSLMLERAGIPFSRKRAVFQPATRSPASHSHALPVAGAAAGEAAWPGNGRVAVLNPGGRA